jgi:hypothetical protein
MWIGHPVRSNVVHDVSVIYTNCLRALRRGQVALTARRLPSGEIRLRANKIWRPR